MHVPPTEAVTCTATSTGTVSRFQPFLKSSRWQLSQLNTSMAPLLTWLEAEEAAVTAAAAAAVAEKRAATMAKVELGLTAAGDPQATEAQAAADFAAGAITTPAAAATAAMTAPVAAAAAGAGAGAVVAAAAAAATAAATPATPARQSEAAQGEGVGGLRRHRRSRDRHPQGKPLLPGASSGGGGGAGADAGGGTEEVWPSAQVQGERVGGRRPRGHQPNNRAVQVDSKTNGVKSAYGFGA